MKRRGELEETKDYREINEKGKKDLDRRSKPKSGSIPKEEQQHESVSAIFFHTIL